MDHHARHKELQRLLDRLADRAPATMAAFEAVQEMTGTDGSLSVRTKELMALSIAIVAGNESCISLRVHDSLAAGASIQEIVETVGVAVRMGGEPALVHGAQALGAADELSLVVAPRRRD